MKRFNTTAVCIPAKHYMVDLSERVSEIKKMVDAGEYFTINRARQYGKTTTLAVLANFLKPEYDVLSLDFQKISTDSFQSEKSFVKAFCRQILSRGKKLFIPEGTKNALNDYISRREEKAVFDELFTTLSEWCENTEKPLVMIIDEVDNAAGSQVFLDFLSQLRADFLEREIDPDKKTFQSVILAGVTDVKHLKNRMRSESEHKDNSPWNIASDFNIDMSLSESGIQRMLVEYENDHHTGMDTGAMAKRLRDYTNGYPFLVSRICQLIDETVSRTLSLSEAWTTTGFDEAIKMLLAENNTLFQSLTKNLNNHPELRDSVRSILMEGTRITWTGQQDSIVLMQMYGFIRNDNNTVRISNRIFETILYNLFLSDEELKRNVFSRQGDFAKNIFVRDGILNVRLILEHFIETYIQIYGPLEEKFKEKDGREQFLLYLKPIINGTGNYYIEAQTRDQKRTDVNIDYLGHQYVIEMKIWHGERYNAEGEKQISGYLDYWHLNTGYMLSFNFNKKKKPGVERIRIGDKVLFEGTV
ncbi:MAG: AAA-like domain-containing protein [Clostridia bacterium]|nr:AAA-like domain-containing protein [Clostridia bacterium]